MLSLHRPISKPVAAKLAATFLTLRPTHFAMVPRTAGQLYGRIAAPGAGTQSIIKPTRRSPKQDHILAIKKTEAIKRELGSREPEVASHWWRDGLLGEFTKMISGRSI